MPINEEILCNYFNGLETSAAAIRALNIEIPFIRLSDAIPDGMTPEKIRKLLNLLPIKSLEVDLDTYWGEHRDILMALNHGRWLTKLRLMNCRETIHYLPINIREIDIYALDETVTAIKEIVKLEELRKIRLVNGAVDIRTLFNTTERETWIDELELVRTVITSPSGLCRSGARIYNFITTDVKLNGTPATQEQINQIVHE